MRNSLILSQKVGGGNSRPLRGYDSNNDTITKGKTEPQVSFYCRISLPEELNSIKNWKKVIIVYLLKSLLEFFVPLAES